MDKPIYTIAPRSTAGLWQDNLFLLLLALLVACIVAAVWSVRQRTMEHNRRVIVQMLSAFVGFIAFGFLVLKVASSAKIADVKLYRNRLETASKQIQYSEIRDFFVQAQLKYAPLQPDQARDTARFLHIQTRDDNEQIFSDGDYPIDTIFVRMNTVMGKE